MKTAWIGLLAVAFLAPAACLAGDVSFLPDGKSVARCEKGVLRIKDLDDESHEREVKLPEALREESPSLTRTPGGLLVAAGLELAMTWNPVSKEWKEFWHAPEGRQIGEVACDPKSGGILFVTYKRGRHGEEDGGNLWFYLPKEATEPAFVYNRRAPWPVNPSFDAEGNLHYICHGDLWKGYIVKGDYPETPFVLGGKRTWPIADLETERSSRDGALAEEVVAFGDRLLVHLDYSHSSGSLVRLPNVDPYKEGLPIKWEEVCGIDGYAAMAVSPNGKIAATWISMSKRWFVMEKPAGDFEPLSTDADVDRHAKWAEEEDKAGDR